MRCTEGSPTTKRCAGPDGDRDLDCQGDLCAARRDQPTDLVHDLLHLQRARRRSKPVVAVDPRRHRVTAEVDDAATPHVQPLQQGREHPVEGRRELLGTAPAAELRRERLGQRGETGYVDEDGRTVRHTREILAPGQRPTTVSRDVGLRVVSRQQRRDP